MECGNCGKEMMSNETPDMENCLDCYMKLNPPASKRNLVMVEEIDETLKRLELEDFNQKNDETLNRIRESSLLGIPVIG